MRPTTVSSRRVGEFLVERRVLSRDAVEELLAREESDGIDLCSILQLEQVVSEQDLTAAVAHDLGVRFVDLADHSILPDVWGIVPDDFARARLAVAVERGVDGMVVVVEDPGDELVLAELAAVLGTAITPAIAVRSDLERLVEQMYGPASDGPADSNEATRSGPTQLLRAPQIDVLLDEVVRLGGSDLHLTVGSSPVIRVQGVLRRIPGVAPLNGSDVRRLVLGMLSVKQRERLLATGEFATSHAIPGKGRFRVSAFVQRDSVGAVLRVVPGKIPSSEDLGLPETVAEWAAERRGLVLVCGPHGSGMSTTLACLVDRVNRSRAAHILTIEEPIEFLHQHQRGLVNQREVGEDTETFESGLRYALRQDPDVIVSGELPDVASIRLVLGAAETGHLVLAALRTIDAVQTVERMIEVFPFDQQAQARSQLASTLRGIVVQQLVPAIEGGRVLATEVVLPTTPVLESIRSGESATLAKAILGGSTSGMGTMDQSLARLVKQEVVDLEVALAHAVDPKELHYLLSGDNG